MRSSKCNSLLYIAGVIVRLGGFHLVMSYVGSIGYIMAVSGIEGLWETVYAANSIPQMLTGHSYARALSPHLSTSAAVFQELVEDSQSSGDVDREALSVLLEKCSNTALDDVWDFHAQSLVAAFTDKVEALLESASLESRTAKLWVQYVRMVSLLKLYLFATKLIQPVYSTRPPAPNRLLKMVSCSCKFRCKKTCGCRRVSLFCISLCAHCSAEAPCDNLFIADGQE